MAELETGRAELRPDEVGQVTFLFSIKAIAVVLLAGFLLHLFLASLPGFGIDLGTFQAWSLRLADRGPWNFYDRGFFADYAPGYLYILWLIGGLNKVLAFDTGQFHYMLKLPAVFADLASAYLLYRMLAGQRPLFRLGAPILYLLFPATILIGPVWGQIDSLLALFLLLSVYYISRGRPIEGSIAYVVGFVIKPQAIAALPFLAFWIMRQHPPRWAPAGALWVKLPVPPRIWFYIIGAAFGVLLLLILPFFPDRPWNFYDQLKHATEVYPYNSLNAYNFWGMFGFFKSDGIQHLGLADRYWGLILFGAATVGVIYVLRRSEGTGALALGAALSTLAFYVFLTRMHERYMFPFFLPFLAACVLLQSRLLWGTFIVFGIVQFLDLYFVYSYYPLAFPAAGQAPQEPFFRPLYDLITHSDVLGLGLEAAKLLSIVTVATFLLLLLASYVLRLGFRRSAAI